jgi:putative membrane protein
MAGASTVVDVTLELLSQLAFTAFGLALFLLWYQASDLGGWLIVGVALSVLTAAGFLAAQRWGLFELLERLTEKIDVQWAWNSLPGGEGVHASIGKIYRHHGRILAGTAAHLVAWFVGAGEAWVGLWSMGHALPLTDVLILESIAFALRTAAFVIPSRLGVQEGGYILLGALFGLTPEVALALSLLKRAREIVTGIPCLIVWQWVEARRLLWGLPSKARCGRSQRAAE